MTSRNRVSRAAAAFNGSAGAHSWQFNRRRDANSQFDDVSTGFAGYGYRISPAWRVHASRGTSFVAPSFNQLYYPGFGTPTLQPEEGRNTDVGVSYTQGERQIKLELTDGALTLLGNIGFDPVYGARPLKRAIQSLVENPLARMILDGQFGAGDQSVVDAEQGGLAFRRG